MYGSSPTIQHTARSTSTINHQSSTINPFPILPYPTQTSPLTSTVDPVTGRMPQITLPDAPLRVCLLSAAYPPKQYEGVGRHTHLMAQGLYELGHQVHVIAEGVREQVTYYDGAYVHRIPCPTTRYPRYRSLPKLHRVLNYSHAVADTVRRLELNDGVQVVDSPVWGVDGLVTAIQGRLPVVVRPQTALRQVSELQQNLHDDFRLVGELEQRLVVLASHLVPNSEATVKALREVYAMLPGATYTMVPHGIVPVADSEVRPFPAASPPAVLTVLYVGRLEKRKGTLDLFAAIPAVLQQVPNARFVLAGSDNSIADGFQARMGEDYPTYFARNYPQVLDRVTFLGAVAEDELQSLYQTCDLFVAPSLYESFGLIYLEAMNYAKPVVGCRAGGIPEVVEDGVTGRLVDPGTPAELAATLAALLRAPDQLREMGIAGRQRLLERFTYLHMARRLHPSV